METHHDTFIIMIEMVNYVGIVIIVRKNLLVLAKIKSVGNDSSIIKPKSAKRHNKIKHNGNIPKKHNMINSLFFMTKNLLKF